MAKKKIWHKLIHNLRFSVLEDGIFTLEGIGDRS